jgi:hypothetical protein
MEDWQQANEGGCRLAAGESIKEGCRLAACAQRIIEAASKRMKECAGWQQVMNGL